MAQDKKIELTKMQIWFIECAIELRNAVLPLDKDNLDAKIFRQDYGFSKKAIQKEIEDLKIKIKHL